MKKFSSSAFAVAAFLSAVPAFATLTPSTPRGERTVLIPVAGSASELCVIPTHLSQAKYSAKDLDQELGLCSLVSGANAATCPKVSSTNPGVEFFRVPDGMTAAAMEAKECKIPDPKKPSEDLAKKVAKYKQSVSCSYTPSILGYYHLSRLLGGAGNVPPSVLRTFDINHHKEIAAKGLAITSKRYGTAALIYQTWSGLMSVVKAGAASKKKDAMFTDSIGQTYGALQLNPTGEAKYSEFFSAAKGKETRAAAYRDRNAIFQNVKSPKAISQIIGREFTASNVQLFQQMKDSADMVLLDTLMSQQDRFGNVHSVEKFAYLGTDDKGVLEVKTDSKLTPEIKAKGAVAIKIMMLKDNDCGVAKTNIARAERLLEKVAHMDPKTYKRLLELDRSADGAEIVTAFKTGMMFTTADWIGASSDPGVRPLIAESVKLLKSRCQSGQLKLDLDIDAYFTGRQAQQNCEL